MGVDKIDIPKLLDPDPEILKSVDDEIKKSLAPKINIANVEEE